MNIIRCYLLQVIFISALVFGALTPIIISTVSVSKCKDVECYDKSYGCCKTYNTTHTVCIDANTKIYKNDKCDDRIINCDTLSLIPYSKIDVTNKLVYIDSITFYPFIDKRIPETYTESCINNNIITEPFYSSSRTDSVIFLVILCSILAILYIVYLCFMTKVIYKLVKNNNQNNQNDSQELAGLNN